MNAIDDSEIHHGNPAALAILRIGLGLFLLLWGIDKIVAPEGTAQIFDHFYRMPLSAEAAPIVGIAEALLGLAFMAGLWKTVVYGLGLLLHAVSTLASYSQLLNPFGDNHLFIAAIPVLAGFIALFLLRDQDTHWSLDRRERTVDAPAL